MRFHSQKLLVALFSLGIFGSCSPVKTPVGVSVSPRLGEVMLDPSSKGTVKMKFGAGGLFVEKGTFAYYAPFGGTRWRGGGYV